MYSPKSRFGYLHNIYKYSGIGENPVITNKELRELLKLCQELINVMDDTNNRHSAVWFRVERNGIENMIEARTNPNNDRF